MIPSCSPRVRVPRLLSPNTPSYVDEGTSTSGWTLDNATLSQPDATTIRLTQTTAGGANGKMYRGITMPLTTDCDWALYFKVRGRRNASDAHRITLQSATGGTPGVPRVSLYFNFNSVTNASADGTISLRYTNSISANTNVVVATGVSYDTDWQDMGMFYDSKFGQVIVARRMPNGRWLGLQRVLCVWFGAQLDIVTNNASVSGAWFEFDWLELTHCNFIGGSDSSGAGNTEFSPNPAEGLTNWESQLWAHMPVALDVRNNYIMNRGVGGNTTALLLSRFAADFMNHSPKVVFLGFCNNDNASLTLAQRHENLQDIIDLINAGGAKAMGFPGVTRLEGFAGQPAYRDYYVEDWKVWRGLLSGLSHSSDHKVVLCLPNGYLNPDLTQPDGAHKTEEGYHVAGNYYAGMQTT